MIFITNLFSKVKAFLKCLLAYMTSPIALGLYWYHALQILLKAVCFTTVAKKSMLWGSQVSSRSHGNSVKQFCFLLFWYCFTCKTITHALPKSGVDCSDVYYSFQYSFLKGLLFKCRISENTLSCEGEKEVTIVF